MPSAAAKRALILTVGLDSGGDHSLVEALARNIDRDAYDFVTLISSAASAGAARRLLLLLQWPEESASLELVESAHDLDEVFRVVNSAIHRLIARGYSLDRITVNYTGGTKVMSSGAVLSAIYNSCEQLEYMTGLGGAGGRARRTLTTRPRAIYAYRELLRAHAHMLATEFRSAADSLSAIDESLLSKHDRALTESLRLLVTAYSAWDMGRLTEFWEPYRRVEFGAKELEPFRLRAEQHEPLERLTEDCRTGRTSELLGVEMRNGAVRHYQVEHFDGAVQRLYRALEVLAQWTLAAKYQIQTDDLDPRKVPPRHRVRFEAIRSLDDGRIKIGLRKAFELLGLLDDPLGIDFASDLDLAACLANRDMSLLAHGVAPVTRETCRRFLAAGSALFERRLEGFRLLCRGLQFPWWKDEHCGDEHKSEE